MVQLTLTGNTPTAMRKESNKVMLGEHRRPFYFIHFIPMTKQMKGSSILVRTRWADTPTELERKILQLVISERARTKMSIKHRSGSGLSHRDVCPWGSMLETRVNQLQTSERFPHAGTWSIERGCLFVLRKLLHDQGWPQTYVPNTRSISMYTMPGFMQQQELNPETHTG